MTVDYVIGRKQYLEWQLTKVAWRYLRSIRWCYLRGKYGAISILDKS